LRIIFSATSARAEGHGQRQRKMMYCIIIYLRIKSGSPIRKPSQHAEPKLDLPAPGEQYQTTGEEVESERGLIIIQRQKGRSPIL